MSEPLEANYIDICAERISAIRLHSEEGRIRKIEDLGPERKGLPYILPGFVDAHVHIESSMLLPSEFGRMAVVHGTVGTVSDPHEIANVLGKQGVEYMIANAKQSPFKCHFGAPSCVPATAFETAGAELNAEDIAELMQSPDIYYLAEVMNYPAVLAGDAEILAKIEAAKAVGKPVDGHAPNLRGEDARRYIAAGMSTDHECTSYEQAKERLDMGMKILIREGSAAKNFEALIDLLKDYPEHIMFCSDDKHPDDLLLGHINLLVKRALAKGISLFKVLRAACINPVEHYKLDIGLLREGDWADYILIDNPRNFNVQATVLNGQLAAEAGQSFLPRLSAETPNIFAAQPQAPSDFQIAAQGEQLRLIRVLDGELLTLEEQARAKISEGFAEANPAEDMLKFAVLNRYQAAAKPALAFLRGMGLQQGAIASCVGHDSHNILAVGCDDESLCRVVNALIAQKGGIAAVSASGELLCLPLPVAGILSNAPGEEVAEAYARIDRFSKEVLGSTLKAPFMSLSFMALLVIPKLKLSDKGLFDGEVFDFVSLFVD